MVHNQLAESPNLPYRGYCKSDTQGNRNTQMDGLMVRCTHMSTLECLVLKLWRSANLWKLLMPRVVRYLSCMAAVLAARTSGWRQTMREMLTGTGRCRGVEGCRGGSSVVETDADDRGRGLSERGEEEGCEGAGVGEGVRVEAAVGAREERKLSLESKTEREVVSVQGDR